MAIQLNTTTETGFQTMSYSRVERIILSKETACFTIKHYKDPLLPCFKTDTLSCSYDLFGDNPYKQVYTYLKTLPEFKDAEDC